MSAVTKEDVARLHTYLVVPVAVSEALTNAAPLEGETQYAMHVALSEIDPDSALLAIALCAHRIAVDFIKDTPSAAALKIEANRIIEDYAPDWLANYHNTPIVGEELYDLLSHVPEDLESIADLLDSMQASIRDTLDPASTICSILSVQARAHMEIADYVLRELDSEREEGISDFDGVCAYPSEAIYAPDVPRDNIILFPVHRRK